MAIAWECSDSTLLGLLASDRLDIRVASVNRLRDCLTFHSRFPPASFPGPQIPLSVMDPYRTSTLILNKNKTFFPSASKVISPKRFVQEGGLTALVEFLDEGTEPEMQAACCECLHATVYFRASSFLPRLRLPVARRSSSSTPLLRTPPLFLCWVDHG